MKLIRLAFDIAILPVLILLIVALGVIMRKEA